MKPPARLSVYCCMPESELLAELRALRGEVAAWRQEHRIEEAERTLTLAKALRMQRWLLVLQCVAAVVGVGSILFGLGITLWGYLSTQSSV